VPLQPAGQSFAVEREVEIATQLGGGLVRLASQPFFSSFSGAADAAICVHNDKPRRFVMAESRFLG
jgi:hypothetical protein